MEKLVYVVLASPELAPPVDGPAIVDAARETFDDPRYRGVSVHLPRPDVEAARDRARGSAIAAARSTPAAADGAERLVAMLSLWMDCADERADANAFAGALGSRVLGYEVTEAVPRWRSGPDGSRPPNAICAVTLMSRRPGSTRAEFLEHWYARHQPLSLGLHPQWGYVRNVVVGSFLDGRTTHCDAIAEGSLAEPDDLIDPLRFYGATTAAELEANRAMIVEDVPRFLDLAATTTYVTEEHPIARAWTPGRGG